MEVDKEVVTTAGGTIFAAIVAGIGWLLNKVYRNMGDRITNLKLEHDQDIATCQNDIRDLYDLQRRRADEERDRHERMLEMLGDQHSTLAYIKGKLDLSS